MSLLPYATEPASPRQVAEEIVRMYSIMSVGSVQQREAEVETIAEVVEEALKRERTLRRMGEDKVQALLLAVRQQAEDIDGLKRVQDKLCEQVCREIEARRVAQDKLVDCMIRHNVI